MTTRLPVVGVLLLLTAAGPAAADDPAAPSPAQRLWEDGQDALRDGRTDEAMRLYERAWPLTRTSPATISA